jgi:hypothetical protein
MVINEIFLRAFQIIISIKIEIAKAIDKLIFIFCPRRGVEAKVKSMIYHYHPKIEILAIF